MRKRLLIALMAFLPIVAFAQDPGGHVRRPVKKQQTTKETSVKDKMSRQLKMNEQERQDIIQNLIDNMVYVEGGPFVMGSNPVQGKVVHVVNNPHIKVTLSTFYIGKYEVTQNEWEAVMGQNPSKHKGANRPVENVSWNDCQEFIRKLNAITGKLFHMPTEAEWEYAAYGGHKSEGFIYAGSNSLNEVAWFSNNSSNITHNVGQKNPNELGLYDMSGNVEEWCVRIQEDNDSQTEMPFRGGSGSKYDFEERNCPSFRSVAPSTYKDKFLGLRIVL